MTSSTFWGQNPKIGFPCPSGHVHTVSLLYIIRQVGAPILPFQEINLFLPSFFNIVFPNSGLPGHLGGSVG